MKRELEKLTGPMLEEAERVKRVVKNEAVRPVRNRQLLPSVIGIAAVLVAVVLAFVWLSDNGEEVAVSKDIPEHIVQLDEEHYKMRVFEQRFLRGVFVTQDYAKLMAFHELFENAALASYLHYRGVTLNDEEKKALDDSINQFIESFNSDQSMQRHYQPLLDEFTITLEQFLEKEFYSNQYVDILANKSDVTNEENVRMKAKEYYYPFVEEQVRAYEQKYGFQFDIETNYWTALEENSAEPITERLDFQFDNTLEHLGVYVDEAGEYAFVNPTYTSLMFQGDFHEELEEVQARLGGNLLFGPFAFKDYKRVVQELVDNGGEVFSTFHELLEILKLLEYSFAGEYEF